MGPRGVLRDPASSSSSRAQTEAADYLRCGSPTKWSGHSTYPNEGHTLAAVPVKVTEMMFPELSNWITVRPLPSAKPWRLAGASDGKPMKSVGPSVTSVLLEKLIFAGPLMFRLMLVPVVTFVSVTKTGP
jgi:hypothetical protein